jgi:hypothetical protein
MEGTGTGAATYAQIAERTGLSHRQARRVVEDLCDYYEDELGRGYWGWRLPRESRAAALARLLGRVCDVERVGAVMLRPCLVLRF